MFAVLIHGVSGGAHSPIKSVEYRGGGGLGNAESV